MDYMRFVQHHIETAADITIGCIPYEESRASDFGLMKIDGQVGGGETWPGRPRHWVNGPGTRRCYCALHAPQAALPTRVSKLPTRPLERT